MLLWLMNLDFAGGGTVVASAGNKDVLLMADCGKLMSM